MLDITSIQATSASKDAAPHTARKQAGQSEPGATGPAFEAEYEATAPKRDTVSAEEVETAEADEVIDTIEEPDETADLVGDAIDTDVEFDIEAKDIAVRETSDIISDTTDALDNPPPIALGEAKKPTDPEVGTTARRSDNVQLNTSDKTQFQSQTPDKSRQQNAADQPILNATSQPQKQATLGKTTAETIVMSKAVEQASRAEANSVSAPPNSSEKPLTQASGPMVQSAKMSQMTPVPTKEQAAVAVSPLEARQSRSAETKLRTTDAPLQSQPQTAVTKAAPFTLKATSTPVQSLSKLETKWEKADLMAAASTDVETVGTWDTRPVTQTSTLALSQVLGRAETPSMIARQMAEALQKLPDRPVEISLNPSELGRVRMSITAAEAGITVGVLAERPETLDLMRRNIEQLTREFQSLGYENINFTFAEGETRQSFGGERNPSSGQTTTNLELETHQDTQTGQPSLIASTGVDIRL